jgi:hypothetical protein
MTFYKSFKRSNNKSDLIMEIKFRNFEDGDSEALATHFTLCFHRSRMGQLRTPKGIRYRFIDRPHSNPKEIHIAYDVDTKQIIRLHQALFF